MKESMVEIGLIGLGVWYLFYMMPQLITVWVYYETE